MQNTGNTGDSWLVHHNGQQYGPFSKSEMAAMLTQGSLTSASQVWREGMEQWVPIGNVIPPQVRTQPPPPPSPVYPPAPVQYQAPSPQASSNRVAAGVFGILLGCLGIHKFVLGFTTAGIIMLLVSVLGSFCYLLGPVVMGIIGLIEGIIYLTKTDAQFHHDYVVNKKEWF